MLEVVRTVSPHSWRHAVLPTAAVPPPMRGFVDLHSHWVAAIDDGARSTEEAIAMLRELHQAGFDVVVATPHMRPGMFDNDKLSIERAFERTRAAMQPMLEATGATPIPEVHLASEHFFD